MTARIAPVEMVSRRYGYFPKTFYMSKVKHTVSSVVRMWTTSKKKELRRHYFVVNCKDGVFELYQNLNENTWYGKKIDSEDVSATAQKGETK